MLRRTVEDASEVVVAIADAESVSRRSIERANTRDQRVVANIRVFRGEREVSID
ncbi:hypothetical protein Scep_006791 [Stephania cephalantha]|uniref:Uncharacterized protein n=1 Tax=Stephania cephalantha TaxID=152367 RepID=A0AAP0KA78_9MAGN